MSREQSDSCSLINFIKEYDQQVITEWEKAYIDFSSLKYFLLYLKNVYQRHHHQFFRYHQAHIQILPLQEDTKQNFEESVKFLDLMLISGKRKVQSFIRYKTSQIIYLWEELLQIVAENESSAEEHDIFEKRSDIKVLLRIIYANIDYLRHFIQLNNKIQICLQKVKQNYVRPFKSQYQPLREINRDSTLIIESNNQNQKKDQKPNMIADQLINNSDHNQSDKQDNLRSSTRQSESQDVYLEYIQKASKQLHSSIIYLNKQQQGKLRKYTRFTTKFTSTKNYFLLGLYIGLGSVIFFSLIVLLVMNFISLAYDDQKIDSMNYIFPMFRGVGLLILYLWGMAWNAYGYAAYKINFKNILEYGDHYSTHFQIMKRAGFFTLVFCVMLFLYLLGLEVNNHDNRIRLPIQYAPFVVWTIYFLYIFFPNRQVFNPRGRKYFYQLVKSIILSPVVRITFLLSYGTDQLVSFIVPIKDFAYTLCFYTSDFTVNDVKSCLKSDSFDGIIIAYVVALVPLMLRMIQCYKQAKQTTGKFIGHIQMWNFGKYLASVITSTLSFLTSLQPELLPVFIASSIISTSYSYYWDLKNDWGFLEKKSKYRFLRNHLCYKNPLIYYVAIFLNLIFRCSWTLTISPSVVKLIPKSTFLPFLTGLIEILRRCMWNFFRIEKEHVLNCASYTIIKQKPEQILKRLRSSKVRKSFKLIDDGQSSIIHYVKLSNGQSMAFYRKLMNLELPLVSQVTVIKQRQYFEKLVQNQRKQALSWGKQIRSHIFYNVKQKFY